MLISYSEITYYNEYHVNVPLIFQGHSEDVEVMVSDPGDLTSRSFELDPLACKGADALILCYPIQDPDQFENLSCRVSA